MGLLLFIVRLPLVLLWLVSSLLCVATIYPLLPLAGRSRMNEAWSRTIVRICGVRLKVSGNSTAGGPSLWVANHVSWIDIFILAGLHSVLFVAKREIRGWPVIGWLVAKVGAIFIDRNQRNSLKEVGVEMRKLFEQRQVIGLFAEGTTSTGFDVLPFRSSLFEPAIRAGLDIQPVALRFFYKGQRSDFAAFVGDETLLANLFTLMCATGVSVEVEFFPVLTAAEAGEMGRARVAAYLEQMIGDAVRVQAPEGVR